MATASGPGNGGSRDAAVMEDILKEMGVADYEPNVINQMLELSYRKYSIILNGEIRCKIYMKSQCNPGRLLL